MTNTTTTTQDIMYPVLQKIRQSNHYYSCNYNYYLYYY